MSNEELDFEVKQTYHYLSVIKRKFKLDECFSTKQWLIGRIMIVPFSFLTGGIVGVVVGAVRDGSNQGDRENSQRLALANSAIRTIVYPIKTAIRFFTGGCINVGLTLEIGDRPFPLISGAVTGFHFANGARPVVLLGSTLGMALLAQVADFILDGFLNKILLQVFSHTFRKSCDFPFYAK